MINNSITKTLAVCLSILMVTTPLFAQTSTNDYLQGKIDGEADAEGQFYWFFSGCLLGVIGIVLPLVIEPSVPTEKLIGKSKEYIMGYTEGYKSKVKNKNAMYSVYGCLTSVAATLLIWSLAASSAH